MENLNGRTTVLVTGSSGFIATHCILQLLQQGYAVRGTLRSTSRKKEVLAMLATGGATDFSHLSFVEADLSADDHWETAAAGCDYVLHIASPTPLNKYRHDDELIRPAREGVLRVLRAARKALVKRVVLTSSFGAIGFGHPHRATPFTEQDTTSLDRRTPAYQRSKTLAERAAWDFIEQEGNGLELAVVNPVGVLGPVLGPDFSHSIQMIKRMLEGAVAGCPKLSSCYIDVRDVAALHLLAMTRPEARGQRFLATTGPSLSMLDVANVLRQSMGDLAAKAPTRELPNWLLRMLALGNPTVRALVPMLGQYMDASGDKAKRVLGWSPRPNERAIADTAESLVKLGLINL